MLDSATVSGWIILLELSLLILGSSFVTACSHAEPSGTSKLAAQEQQQAAQQASLNAKLPRPRKASGVSLRTWLAAQAARASLQRINDCQAQVLALSEAGKDADELRKISKQIGADVAVELELHHWCFYHLLMRLEHQLEQDGLGQGLRNKLQSFLGESKAIWVLAVALDRHTTQNYYRSTVRRRYMELSQLYFGRSLAPATGTMPPDEEDEEEEDEENLINPGDDHPSKPKPGEPSPVPAPPTP